MENNVVELFKGKKSPTEPFRSYENRVDEGMNRGGIELGIISVTQLGYVRLSSDYDTALYYRRLEVALRYLRPTIAIFDVPFPDTRFNLVINRHDQDATSFNILLVRKDLPEPIILRADVLDNGEWEIPDTSETIPYPTFDNDGYDSVYWSMLKSQDRMVNLGAAKKNMSIYTVGEMDYHLTAYTYLRKDDDVNVTVGIMGLINEEQYLGDSK